MDSHPPDNGFDIHLGREVVEWMVSGIWVAFLSALGYVIRLAQRVTRLETEVKHAPDREFIEAQFAALSQRIDRVYERLGER